MITSIRLQNFRSYKDGSFEFEPGANIVVGPNASGKTNLLEAVMVLSSGNSYKAKDLNLMRHKAAWTRLDGFFGHQERSLKLELKEESLIKTYLIDTQPFKRLSLERSLPVVLFEPEHLQAIIRGPDRRREYFDDLLERSVPGFKTLSAAYRRTLAQRNALLKKGSMVAAQQIFAWNIRLAEYGSKISAERNKIVEELALDLAKTYSQIAGKKTKVEISYDHQMPIENYASRMVAHLEKNINKELERGFTLFGPHREDIIIKINNQPIGLTASRGEVRTLLLSLKKLELSIIEHARSQKPILLLDDVLSELDGARRQALVDILKDHQSILTTTDADAAVDHFSNSAKLISLT